MSEIGAIRSLPAPFDYPSRRDGEPGVFDGLIAGVGDVLGLTVKDANAPNARRKLRLVTKHARRLQSLSDDQLTEETAAFRAMARSASTDARTAQTLAIVREVARREIGLFAHEEQLLGAQAILEGRIAEMDTGEGKTLTAALAAGTKALNGTPVHVVTVNDYLATRDAAVMGPIYEKLGLSVASIAHEMERDERRSAYAADVVYVSNKEVAFDYLRDRIVQGPDSSNLRLKLRRLHRTTRPGRSLVMRGLHFAIVDEADSVLIDEARTPLVISNPSDPGIEAEQAEQKLALVRGLKRGLHFEASEMRREIELTEEGRRAVLAAAADLPRVWQSRIRREEAAAQALCALHIYREGIHYLVQDEAIQIVDEYTGRIMEDRSWNSGLHQLIELKEGVPVTGRQTPVARISYQRFFLRYLKLAGMTGTAREVSGELRRIYGLSISRVPRHERLRRRQLRTWVLRDEERKWSAIAREARKNAAKGAAVLIGTRSVRASEALSAVLSDRDIDHVVLNALQTEEEAQIIADAGTSGRITVATNMAGRGVDIRPDPAVLKKGGLLVILTEFHEASRIDRQLFGRTARQGEPGRYRIVVSLEDELLKVFAGAFEKTLGHIRPLAPAIFRRAQARAEREHARARLDLFRIDVSMGTLLSFAGDAK